MERKYVIQNSSDLLKNGEVCSNDRIINITSFTVMISGMRKKKEIYGQAQKSVQATSAMLAVN